jgi:hypothetical protein
MQLPTLSLYSQVHNTRQRVIHLAPLSAQVTRSDVLRLEAYD